MEENQRASLGGLLRRSMCRWMEGMALKNEQPGMRRVWIIMGTLRLLPSCTTQMEPQAIWTIEKRRMKQTTMGP